MKAKNLTNINSTDQVSELQNRINYLEKELTEQKRIQKSHAIHKKKLSAILEQNADGIVIVDQEGKVLYVNPAAELLFNRNKNEFIGSLFGFPVSTDKEICTHVIRNGELLREVEFRVVEVQSHGQPAFQISVHDITALMQTKNKLNKSEKKFKSITENSADAIFIVDSTGNYVYTNKAATILLGFSSEELKGKTIADLSPKNKQGEILELFKIVQSKGSIFTEIQLLKNDGATLMVDLNAVVLHDGLIYGSCRDISERKQAEQSLIASETRYRRLFESAKDGILILDAETGRIEDVNPFLIEMLGYSKEQIIEKTIWEIGLLKDIFANRDKFLELQQLKYVRYEDLPLETKNGKEIHVEFVSNVYLVNQHKVIQCNIRDITVRKQTEKEIQNLAKFPSQNPNPVIRIDEKGIILYANKSAEKIFRDWCCVVGDKAPDGLISKVFMSLSDDTDKAFEIVHNQRFFAFYIAPILNEGYINLYGIDITALRKTQDELNLQKYFTDSLLFNIPDSIYFKDLESRFLKINKAMANLFGLDDPIDVVGMTDKDFFKSNHAQQAFFDEEHIIKTGNPIINKEELETWPERPPSWVSTTKMPLKDKKGKIIGTFGISRDITEHKQTEEKLKQAKEKAEESEAKFRELFSRVGDAIFIYDPNTFKIAEANKATSEIYGYSNDELIGMSCLELSAEVDKSITVAKSIVNEETINVKVRHHKKKDGTDIFVELNTYNILINGKNIVYSVCHNITDIKKTEAELIKARDKAEESDQLKTAFLHNVSHEIRTPLNAILGFSGFLNDPDLLPEKRKSYIAIIKQSSDQLLQIISDIVSIAAIEAGQEKIEEKEINLNSMCELIYEQLSIKETNTNVSLNFQPTLSSDDSIVLSDGTKLTQVLSNLVGNALKFTSQGYVNFGYTLKGNELEFYTVDSGIGIPLDMQDVIFHRFRQVETTGTRIYGGSGLGLAISRAYVEMLGGKMWLTSELNKGSEFYFTIPFKKANAEVSPEIQPDLILNSVLKMPMTLLIAEDEDTNFMLLQELLSNESITIIRAANGLEAVDLCKSNPHIDLVLMDIKMPKMDGYEATTRIREFNAEIHIIAQTAYSTEADKNRAFVCGCSDFMSKPIIKEMLLSKINAHCP